MDKDKKFPDGLNFSRPKEGSPEFVKGRVGVHTERFITWLRDNGGGEEWVNLQLLQSKDGTKLYFQHDTWKKAEASTYPQPEGDIAF